MTPSGAAKLPPNMRLTLGSRVLPGAVDSADAYYDEWRDRVEIRRPPKNQPWGARTFDVIGPFGNTIFVMGPVHPTIERLQIP